MRHAASLWPRFAERTGLALDQSAAEWRGPDLAHMAERLTELGFEVELAGSALRVRGDIRIEAERAMVVLTAGLGNRGIEGRAVSLSRSKVGWRLRTTAGDVQAESVVMAIGASAPPGGLPPSVATTIETIQPISGQIGRAGVSLIDRVVRGRDGYVVPSEGGVLIGATMVQGGRSGIDDTASRHLVEFAESLTGRAVTAPVLWKSGVRGATTDGLPLAGPTGEPGLHLALAPRRNGWLLGPLVGRVVADGIEGQPPDRYSAAFDPMRFTPAQ
jgi:glycine oxidase